MTKKNTLIAKAWPGAKLWALDKIKPYPNNPRLHPPEQIVLLAEHLKRFGPDQPIVVDERSEIIKGHGRLESAKMAGLKEFPVVQRFGLTEDDKRALRIADNQIALLSGWDHTLMGDEIVALQAAGYEMPLLGFDADSLASFLPKEPALKDPEATPEPTKRPSVRAGELWELGDHRIICGDSTDPKVWARLFGTQRAAMTFTDPPYGVSYEAKSGEFAVIEGDHKRRDDLFKMLVPAFVNMAKVSADQAAFYIWHASATKTDFGEAMTRAGLVERQYLIWAKPSIGLGYSDYRWAHEPVFYASKAEKAPAFYGEPNESTVWRVQQATGDGAAVVIGPGLVVLDGQGHTLYLLPKSPKAKKPREIRLSDNRPVVHVADDSGSGTVWEVSRDRDYKHPTQKPVELARRAINNSSKRGEIVADGFAGSGTTIMGADMTGRRCFAVELDPAYAQVCIERWQEFSGKAATLDGETFAAIAKQRSKGNAKGDHREAVPTVQGDKAALGVRQRQKQKGRTRAALQGVHAKVPVGTSTSPRDTGKKPIVSAGIRPDTET